MIVNSVPSENELSHIKGRIGEIYLETLCLSVNYSCTSCKGSDFDSLGIDYMLINYPQGTKRDISVEDSKTLYIQIKGTSKSSLSMFKDNGDEYIYTLSKSVYRPSGMKTLIVIVCAPEEDTYGDWILIEAEKLLLHSTAYFIEVPKNGFKEQTKIKIPKSNVLNKESLEQIFIN